MYQVRRTLLYIVLVVMTGGFYYIQADTNFQRDSDLFCNNMLAAGILDIDVSDCPFGLRTYGIDDIEFSDKGGNNVGSILYLLFHTDSVAQKDIQLISYRRQQIGLQGWATYYFARVCDMLSISGGTSYYLLRLFLSILLAAAISTICFLLYHNYNLIFATMFYVVSTLSPWLINFSTSSYWVTFTFFLPLLIGLVWVKYQNRTALLCFLMMLTVALKAGCGYEYISTVMVSAVIFPIYSTVKMIGKEKKTKVKRIFAVVIKLGFACFAGFFLVLLINGYMRGTGNLAEGLHALYYNDVLRRTYGNAANYGAATAPSLNASLITVLKLYLVSSTTGRVASLLLIVNLGFFIKNRKKRSTRADLILLLCSLAGALSWLILAKSHSHAHTHINSIVFYIGYMQIAVYLMIKGVLSAIPIKMKQIQKCLQEE